MATIDVALPVGWSKLHVTIELEAPMALPTRAAAEDLLEEWDALMGVLWTTMTIQQSSYQGIDFFDLKATYLGGPEILRSTPQRAPYDAEAVATNKAEFEKEAAHSILPRECVHPYGLTCQERFPHNRDAWCDGCGV